MAYRASRFQKGLQSNNHLKFPNEKEKDSGATRVKPCKNCGAKDLLPCYAESFVSAFVEET